MSKVPCVHEAWWGVYCIPKSKTAYWRIGPLNLWVQRLADEWRIAWESLSDPLDPSLEINTLLESRSLLDHENTHRFALAGESEEVELKAALADRPMVTRSEKPLSVPAGEDVEVFVSSPLWVTIWAKQPDSLLAEIPIYRPSDTWFGPNTWEGELCYASKTFHRIRQDQISFVPHRATTAVLVQNHVNSMLPLERMQLPVNHLALYCAKDGRLWTEDVIFLRSGTDDFAALKTRPRRQAKWAEQAVRIAEPRITVTENLVVRAFGSIFGGFHSE